MKLIVESDNADQLLALVIAITTDYTACKVRPWTGEEQPTAMRKWDTSHAGKGKNGQRTITRKRWTKADEVKILKLNKDGVSNAEIARMMGRTSQSINRRLWGLKNDAKRRTPKVKAPKAPRA